MAWWLIKYKNNFAQTEPLSSLLWILIWRGASNVIFSPDNGHILFQCTGLLSPTIHSLSLYAHFHKQCKDVAVSLTIQIFSPSNSCRQNASLTQSCSLWLPFVLCLCASCLQATRIFNVCYDTAYRWASWMFPLVIAKWKSYVSISNLLFRTKFLVFLLRSLKTKVGVILPS